MGILVPVRCMSCGKPIGHLWEKFRERVESGEDPAKVLDELGLKRYCCRAVMISTVETAQAVSKYSVKS